VREASPSPRSPGGAVLLRARPEARAWAEGVLRGGRTLYHAAAEYDDALRLEGRGPAWAIPAPGGGNDRWVVRHFRRGGALAARLLGDRYLRWGIPRPLQEMEAGGEASRRGIATPEVMAAAVYPSGAFYRGDLVTRLIPGSADLATLLFPPEEGSPTAGTRFVPPELQAVPAEQLLGLAGEAIGRLAAAGVLHRDLNARNLLPALEGGGVRMYVLDLDRARFRPRPLLDGGLRMVRRLRISLRKWEARTGETLPGEGWEALLEGVRRGGEGGRV